MKTTLLVVAILAVSAYAATSEFESQLLWDQWKTLYQTSYSSVQEDLERFNVFMENLRIIDEWNADPTHTQKLGLNKFSNLTSEEFGALFHGYSEAKPNPEEVLEEIEVPTDLPDEFDWREHGAVTPIKNQGQCGSCWTFAATATIESLYILDKRGSNTTVNFAEQQIVDCDIDCLGCDGGHASFAIGYVSRHGQMNTTDYPYEAKGGKCKYEKEKANQDLTAGARSFTAYGRPEVMKAAIVERPITVAVQANQAAWQHYTGGVVDKDCGVERDHNVAVIGYGHKEGSDAFYIKNSWGTDYGVDGYIYLSTSAISNLGAGICGILTTPVQPKPWSQNNRIITE